MNECAFGDDSFRYNDYSSFLSYIYECNKDTFVHLNSLASLGGKTSTSLPEVILILYRSGLFNIDGNTYRYAKSIGMHWEYIGGASNEVVIPLCTSKAASLRLTDEYSLIGVRKYG